MNYDIERTTPCRVVVTATSGAEDVRSEREHLVAEWQRGARIDGFRKGKAPRALVERRFAEQIREDLEEHLTRRAWDRVVREEKLRPASSLGVKESAWLDSGEYRVKAEFEVYPTVELQPLDGFRPPEFALDPSEDEVAGALEQLRERQAAWEPVASGPAADGMLVEAEVEGSFPDGGGEPFHEERSLFRIGAGEVYPEIEAAVTGAAVGAAVAAERTVGEEGGEARAGKRIAYTVRVKSLRRKRLPELDDAFAVSLGVADGLAALRERLRERLRADKLERRREAWREALVTHLSGGRTLELPETVVRDDTRKELLEFVQAMARRGIDPDRAEMDWPKLEEEMRERVEHRLRAELLLGALADSFGLAVSAEEIDREVESQAQRIGVPFAELRGNLAKGGGLERVGGVLRRERAVDQALKAFVDAGA